MEILFWLSFIFLVYVLIGYPLLLAGLQKTSARTVYNRAIEPTVTILLVVRNESQLIEKRLRNLFELDYPKEKLQIIVSVDGATDGTEAVVRLYGMEGVTLVHSSRHAGKAAAINRAMPSATGEVVVFADARQTFGASAVRELVGNFADHRVGGATGELVLLDDLEREDACPVGIYWRYEKWIRSLESRIHSVVGATGAIYAIRRDLFKPLPEDTILDDVMIPMRIVLAGKRVVFDSAATAFDVVSCCPTAEYHRKVRTLAGNYQLFAKTPQILLPFLNPIAWQVWSHKVGRLAAPFAMVVLFLSNAGLVGSGPYTLLFASQSIWYSVALMGYVDSMRMTSDDAIAAETERKAA